MKQFIWLLIIGLGLAFSALLVYGLVNIVLWSLTVLSPIEIGVIVAIFLVILFFVSYTE